MKKPFLLLLSFIPLLASCNKSGTFPNPFPTDSYTKVGFKLDETNEKIIRPLTTDETNVVLATIEKKDDNDAKIMSNGSKTKLSTRYTRDYTRAFAGEFKQGYNVSNLLKNEEFYVTKQEAAESNKKRTKVHNKIKSISQYSYGQIEENIEQNDYIYYSDNDETSPKEVDSRDDSNSVSMRTEKIYENPNKSKYTKVTDDYVLLATEKGKYKDDGDLQCFNIKQSDYITAPDLKSGADKDGNIILVNATQNKHIDENTGEEGIFSLKDGRRYQAMDNSLIVTKLQAQEAKTWCLATYVRIYKETVITSEVLQPNVPVTKLSENITIHFSEERNYFSISPIETMADPLPEITS